MSRAGGGPQQLLVTAVWIALLACSGASCGRDSAACHFGREHAVFESTASAFDDVALVWSGRGAVAAYSDASGVYARNLAADGTVAVSNVRLGPQCDAGLAAAVGGKGVVVACARRAQASRLDAAGVSLYELTADLGIDRMRQFGHVGQTSHGVALAFTGATASVLWQDAGLDGARIWVSHDLSATTPPWVLSESGWDASAPGLAVRGTQLFATWAETHTLGKGVESRVRMLRLGPAAPNTPATLVTTRDDAPSPELVATDLGLWLSFRDQRRLGRKKTGLYLVRLDSGGKTQAEPVRAGRADGVGRPVLRSCLGGLVAATPRTFAGDYFIGVVRADPRLEQLSGEQQFYEDSHEFAQVAASCVRDRMLLLIAERARLGRGHAALRSVTFSCD